MWVDVCASGDVAAGAVVGARLGEYDLVIWRCDDGRVRAGDRRCPHAWSDLAQVGWVEDCELVCGSHHWRFGPDGTGVKLNMRGRRDLKSPLRMYECEEVDGRVRVRVG